MPSWAIHLLTAKRLSNKIDVDKNIFLIGNLLTDLLNGYVIKEVSSHVLHSETHFDTMTVFDGKKAKRPDLVGFKKKYGKYFLNNPLILGYYTHLATDYFWNSKTYDEYGIFNEEGKRIGVKLNNGKEKICQKEEIRKLNDLTNMFLVFAEDEARERHVMTMKDWIEATDNLLKFRRKNVLDNAGSVSHKQAIEKAENEYEKFKVKQDLKYIPSMDEMYQRYLNESKE